MPATQQFSVALPADLAEFVRAKVNAGEYATESDVIRDGLRGLLAQDSAQESAQESALDAWVREHVVPAYDAYQANPSSGVSLDQVRATLAAEYREAVARR